MNYPTAEQWAAAFIQQVHSTLTPEQIAEVNRRNATPDYAGCCATHDFCDANVLMSSAFKSLTGTEPDETNPHADGLHMPGMADEVGALWDEAWTLAQTRQFQLTKP